MALTYRIMPYSRIRGGMEVTFQDWQDLGQCRGKAGWYKIVQACEQAQAHGLDYLWVDTNCIDKTSSSELSEAINSMFAYYRNSRICYAYLSDVDPLPPGCVHMTLEYKQRFCKSKWFTRGWTLQELLAPTQMAFYAKDWSRIASRSTLASFIASATSINPEYLKGDESRALSHASAAQKMAWLSRRVTTRIEDMAYCMLGIFDINMPLLYGEGSKAFVRLQEEIIKVSNHHTIFCWAWIPSVPKDWVSFLAPDPKAFRYSAGYIQSKSNLTHKRNFMMTNAGLSICLPVVQTFSYYLAILNAQSYEMHSTYDPTYERPSTTVHYLGELKRSMNNFHLAIPIRGRLEDRVVDNSRDESDDSDYRYWQPGIMERISFPPDPCFIQPMRSLCQPELLIRSRPDALRLEDCSARYDRLARPFQHGFLLVLDNVRALDRPRREETVYKAEQSEDLDEAFVRLKLMPTSNIFLTERIGRSERRDSIETYPPGHFDSSRGMVLVKMSASSSGVLVRLGSGEDACVLFLGVTYRHSSQPLRFCKLLRAGQWMQSPDRWLEAHLVQVDQIRGSEESCPTERSDGCSVVINEGVEVRSGGMVFLTYIHHT
ncbi:hypothetical protein F5883DRAFT_580388 [Diaporthe sp. PMI_573]|nr:hypothetical protein F5883DRAFT_580388 [Diaporthaceae sp. PMI_573]